MRPIWAIDSESVAVQRDQRTGSAAEGAPPETVRAVISTPQPCRVMIAAEGFELAFVGMQTIQFRRNPEPGETLKIGKWGSVVDLAFVSGQPPENGVVVGATTADTIDNLIVVLRAMDYGADRAMNDFLQIRAPGFGPAADCYALTTAPYAVEPPPGEERHFRGGSGTYLPGNGAPVAFDAQPRDRVFVLGAPDCMGTDPRHGGGLTVTWTS